jgi:hypothetical protein
LPVHDALPEIKERVSGFLGPSSSGRSGFLPLGSGLAPVWGPRLSCDTDLDVVDEADGVALWLVAAELLALEAAFSAFLCLFGIF